MVGHFFITATGTDIGKTFVLLQLCEKLKKNNQKFNAIKPVISGFSEDDPNTDSAKILKILSKDLNQENLNQISPWRFKAPLSPNIAARLENKKIDFEKLVEFCQAKIALAKKANQHFFIEGAGGVMTPITDDKTYLDLIIALKMPVILVVGNYLGTISHTLTALRVMESCEIKTDRIILNCQKSDKIDPKQNLEILRNFSKIKIELG